MSSLKTTSEWMCHAGSGRLTYLEFSARWTTASNHSFEGDKPKCMITAAQQFRVARSPK